MQNREGCESNYAILPTRTMCQHDEQPEIVCRDAEPEREADGGGSDDNRWSTMQRRSLTLILISRTSSYEQGSYGS